MHSCPLAKTLASVFLAGALAGCSGKAYDLGTGVALSSGAGGTGGEGTEPTTPIPTTVPTEPPPPGMPVLNFDVPARLNVSASFAGWEPDDHEDNVSLTGNGLQMFFNSDHRGEDEPDTSADVWVAIRRTTTTEAWDLPERVAQANTGEAETSPSISLDGKTLWVGQLKDNGDGDQYDIFRLTRSTDMSDDWSVPPIEETTLNTTADDIPRPLGFGESVMPLGSRRKSDGEYHTYLAPRLSDGTFGTATLASELDEQGRPTVDGFLTQDGQVLFFNAEPGDDKGQLYWAWRPIPEGPFLAPKPLEIFQEGEGNGADTDERDPYFDEAREMFYYSSSGAGDDEGRDIYAVPLRITYPTSNAGN